MIEFLIEISVQIMGEIFFGFLADHVAWEGWKSDFVAVLGHGLTGIVLGAATLRIFPQHLISSSSWRAAALVVVPLGLGALFSFLETLKESANAAPFRRFLSAAALGVGFALVRFVFAR
jgi:hypothetical protein